MKIFYIVENFPSEAGHSISIIKNAIDEKDALNKYMEAMHRCALPSWVRATEVIEDVVEIYRFDNLNYEG